jgi:outer membrane autotransporter protein
VAFSPPSSGDYKTLSISGNLSGSGTFHMNANLAGDRADLITVGGASSGSYQLYINNLGGAAAAHMAVKAVGLNASAANTATFSGGGDQGAWSYGIAQGSAISSYRGVNSLTDYYFYNTGSPSRCGSAAIGTAASTNVVWYGEMNEIKKRMGELRMGAQSGDDFWVRTYADKFNVTPAGGESFNQIMRGIELGRDKPQSFAGGKKFTGFLAGTGSADNTFASGGMGAANSIYAGAYGSWLRDDGSYFDLIGKYNWFRHSFNTPLLGGGSDSGSYRNKGFGLSAEIGKRLKHGNGFFVQPEAELSAMWSGSANYASANGLAIQVPSANSLQLRLGCTVGRKWQDVDEASRQIYGKLSWVNEFRGDSRTVVDSAPFDSSLNGHQWVTSVGFVEDGKRYQLYLDAEKSYGNTVSKAWGFNAGYRWKF